MMKYCKSLVLAFFVLGASGCAQHMTQQMEEMQALAKNALQQSSQAYGAAQNALNVANEANLAAEQAQSSVETALDCCRENRNALGAAMREAMRKGRRR